MSSDNGLPWAPGTADYKDALKSGYMGHTLILCLAVFNTMYYGDLQYRRIIQSKYSFWGLGFRTWWGAQATIRTMINFAGWLIIGLFAVVAQRDEPMMYSALGVAYKALCLITFLKFLTMVVFQVMALFLDRNDLELSYHDYFKEQLGYGAQGGVGSYYNSIDIQLEAGNVLGGLLAGGLYMLGMKVWAPLSAMGVNFVPSTEEELAKYLAKKDDSKKADVATAKGEPDEDADADGETSF